MVSLLALAPVVLFALGKSALAGAVTGVNVLIIFGSIYVLLSPTEGGHGGDDESPN